MFYIVEGEKITNIEMNFKEECKTELDNWNNGKYSDNVFINLIDEYFKKINHINFCQKDDN